MAEGSVPLVSIILPTHNRADVLGCAIQSALGQTEGNFELIVVGDGCTDGTAGIVKGYQAADSRIIWNDCPKAPGFGYRNRNTALKQARGEYIAYLAHDDFWLPDHLALTLAELQDPRIDFVHSRPLWVTSTGSVIPVCFNLEEPSIRRNFLERRNFAIPSSAILHRRSCLERFGYWDESLAKDGDWDMWTRIVGGAEHMNCRAIPQVTALHFHAIWKNTSTDPIEHLRTWQLYYDQLGPELPGVLAMTIPEDRPLQHYFWHMCHSDPNAFTAEMRRAVDQIIDRRVMDTDLLLHTVPIERRELSFLAEEFRRLAKAQH